MQTDIKLIIFDLDGVLVDTKEIHYRCLNAALDEKYRITWLEHLLKYDGLKTTQKLDLLTKEKSLPENMHEDVWRLKQENTIKELECLKPVETITQCFEELKKLNYKIACASNSIRDTVVTVLNRLDIHKFFDYIVSNEDVRNGKPHPEMYWECMSFLGVLPCETLIIEDSPKGLLAAHQSGARILRVTSSSDITYKKINSSINTYNNMSVNSIPKWVDKKLNVLIPMAGAGSRFEQAGYTFPKPLIDVKGKPMIQTVIENLNLDANFIFVVQKSHREKYNLDNFLSLIAPSCTIIETDGITEGAACTALLAKDFINNDNPLFFANSDQFVVWNSNDFMYRMQEIKADGGIVTFNATHPKWSFVKADDNNLISEVAEKNPISNTATVGFYYWHYGSDFVKYAEEMIDKNIRVNNEFYVCPVFNQAINDGKKIYSFNVAKMWGLGTPEDLRDFLNNYKED
jgi:HAD superfamily hydrolase (TIGR01509 family)